MATNTDTTADTPKAPRAAGATNGPALAEALARYRKQAEFTPDAIQATLEVANRLVIELGFANPAPFANQRHISALIDCARLAADSLALQSCTLFDAMDKAGDTPPATT